MKGCYSYRGEIIIKNKGTGKWWATNIDGEYTTIDETKNAIDKKLGGWSGRCVPKRWLKDEKLRIEYNS